MRKLHDRFFKQAKRDGYLARSVYKLAELDRKYRLFRPGAAVLDLGASPGSWLEYVIEKIGPQGIACAVDLKVIDKKFKDKAHFKKINVMEMRGDEFAEVTNRFDAVLSDMAPNTSGIKIVDQAKSLELVECAHRLACQLLRPGGHFVCKIFSSPELDGFHRQVAETFREARIRKPEACRSESIETYVVGLGFLGDRR